jgi:hypothetical protein
MREHADGKATTLKLLLLSQLGHSAKIGRSVHDASFAGASMVS